VREEHSQTGLSSLELLKLFSDSFTRQSHKLALHNWFLFKSYGS